jgi:hypothetical protein
MFKLFINCLVFGSVAAFISSFFADLADLNKSNAVGVITVGVILGFLFAAKMHDSSTKKIVYTHGGVKLFRPRSPLCYRIILNIEANPEGFIKKIPQKYTSAWEFLQHLYDDPKLEVNRNTSLLGNSFIFTIYRDENSGMELIYDQTRRQFVDDIEVWRSLIDCNRNILKNKYGLSGKLWDYRGLIMRESEIGHPDPYAPREYQHVSDRLALIPTESIVASLTSIKNYWQAMCAIKAFPLKLQNIMDEYKVKYVLPDDIDVRDAELPPKKHQRTIKRNTGFELYNREIGAHTFATEYMYVSMNIEFMPELF